MGKLRDLKGVLKSWNREVFGDVKIKKQEILKKIEEIDQKEVDGLLDQALKAERDGLKGEFADLIRKENISWSRKQK